MGSQTRKALILNNAILMLASTVMIVFSSWLVSIFFNNADDTETFYINWLGLVFFGGVLFILSAIGINSASRVNLNRLIIHFFGAVVVSTPLILFSVVCFDFLEVFQVWIRHTVSLFHQMTVISGMKDRFQNSEIYFAREKLTTLSAGTPTTIPHNLARLPVNYTSVLDYCLETYNSSECSSIRNQAINSMTKFTQNVLIVQGTVSAINAAQVLISLALCISITTLPVMMNRMNPLFGYLLILPASAHAVVGAILFKYTRFNFPFSWLSYAFISLSVVLLLLTPAGVIAGRKKLRNMLQYYEVSQWVILGYSLSIGLTCIIYAFKLSSIELTDADLVDFACRSNYHGCCCCDTTEIVSDRCPEWENFEILAWMNSDLKIAGYIAVLSIAFNVVCIAAAHIMVTNLKDYKKAFV